MSSQAPPNPSLDDASTTSGIGACGPQRSDLLIPDANPSTFIADVSFPRSLGPPSLRQGRWWVGMLSVHGCSFSSPPTWLSSSLLLVVVPIVTATCHAASRLSPVGSRCRHRRVVAQDEPGWWPTPRHHRLLSVHGELPHLPPCMSRLLPFCLASPSSTLDLDLEIPPPELGLPGRTSRGSALHMHGCIDCYLSSGYPCPIALLLAAWSGKASWQCEAPPSR